MKKKDEKMNQEMENQQPQIPGEEESGGKKILNTVINVILVLAIILAAMCTYVSYVSTSGNGVPSILGIRMFSIQTDSMYPQLLPGDLIFDTAVKDTSELRKGDIITYWTVINGERVLNTHRIEEIYDGGGYLIFATKGDNNTAADALTVHESEIVGKYSFRVPGVGKVFDYLQTSTGFLIVVVVPVFLFFLFHLVQFFRVLFEYQNVKNRIKYEQERGRTEDMIAEQERKQQQSREAQRAAMEAEIREKLKAELLASMAAQQNSAPPAPAAEEAAQEPAAEEAAEEPAAEEAAQEPAAEEAAQEPAAEEAAQEPAAEEAAAEPAGEKPAAPALSEAEIEAIIAQRRAAMEAELREKLRAELLAESAGETTENPPAQG